MSMARKDRGSIRGFKLERTTLLNQDSCIDKLK